jgi:hypothetical protein
MLFPLVPWQKRVCQTALELLKWIWGGCLISPVIGLFWTWFTTKGFDVTGTPLGWVLQHSLFSVPVLAVLFLLTVLAWIGSRSVPSGEVKKWRLEKVRITTESLKQYLDTLIGPHKGMKERNYADCVDLLQDLGFTNLKQVHECIHPYAQGELPLRLGQYVFNNNPPQGYRFHAMILAGMGEQYIKNSPDNGNENVQRRYQQAISEFKKNQIVIGNYQPNSPQK